MIKNKKISFEWGTLSLFCVGLFFMFQIIGAEASVNDIYAKSYAVTTATTTASTIISANTVAANAVYVPNTITEVEKGATNVQLIAVKVTNIGAKDLSLLSIEIPGNYATADISNPVLYSGDTKVGGTLERTDALLTFHNMNISLAKGASVTLTLKGDIVKTTTKTSLTFRWVNTGGLFAKDAAKNTAKVTITAGNSVINIKAATTTVSSLRVAMVPNTTTSAVQGATGIQLIVIKLTNTGNEDVTLSHVEVPGNYDAADLVNPTLYSGDNKIAIPSQLTKTDATFTGLTVKIAKGASVTLTLKGDIVKTTTKTSMTFSLLNVGDFMAKNASKTNAKITVTPGKSVITVTSAFSMAALNIALTTKNIEVKDGDKGVVLQEIKLKNDLNRVGVIKVISFDVKTSIPSGSATINFDNIYLYQGDKQIAKGTNGNTKFSFDNALVSVAAGGSDTLTLRGDVDAGAAAQSLTFAMNLDTNVSSGGIAINTPTVVTGTSSTVKISTVTPANNPALSAAISPNAITDVEKGATGVQLIGVKFTNTGNEDVVLTDLEVSGVFSAADETNTALYSDTAKVIATPKVTDSKVTYSGLTIKIAKGAFAVVTLKGDITKTTTKTSMDYFIESCCLAKAKGVSNKAAVMSVTEGKATLNIKASATAAISATVVPNTATSIPKGSKNVQFMAVKFTNSGSEDIKVVKTGTFGNSSTTYNNMAYYIDDVKMADSTTTAKAYTFNFTIGKGKTAMMVLRGDVVAGATAGSSSFKLDTSTTSISATGVTSGKAVSVTYGVITSSFTITDSAPLNVSLKINKVFYNTDSAHMAGTCPNDNEWVELYNAGASAVNIKNWKICDGQACNVLSTSDLSIPSKGFVIISAKDSTWKYWTIPTAVKKIVTGSTIGDGLTNITDMLEIKDASGNVVDQVNWGTPNTSWANYNTGVWNPGYPLAAEGSILTRLSNGVDTDKAADWTITSAANIKIGQ